MAKVIIECNTIGEGFTLVYDLLCAADEAKLQSYKDQIEATDRGELRKSEFYAAKHERFEKLIRQIANHARVEF